MNILKVGIIIAKPTNGDTSEIERFIADDSADILLFPEGHIHSDHLEKTQDLVRTHKKWLITGMDDLRERDNKFETAVVINPDGQIVGEHKKTSITRWEQEHEYSRGDNIEVIDTDFGKIGLSICYEIHFPEISRIYALRGARVIFNPIGTGMWHEKQYKQWTSVARARASENKVFVLGCSHFNDTIPIAFAFAPDGECLVETRDTNRLISIQLDLDKYPQGDFSERRPDLYQPLSNFPND